jgi:hypothetical protein
MMVSSIEGSTVAAFASTWAAASAAMNGMGSSS